MEKEKKNVVQVKTDGKAPISCPECACLKTVFVKGFRDKKDPIRVKCPCGKKFSISLEFRQQYRLPTDLDGYYVRKDLFRDFDKAENQVVTKTNCRVKDLSRDGVGFERMSPQEVAEGNHVWLQFKLDDAKGSTITREVIVKAVTDQKVGGQFVPRPCGTEPELGFYLMKKK